MSEVSVASSGSGSVFELGEDSGDEEEEEKKEDKEREKKIKKVKDESVPKPGKLDISASEPMPSRKLKEKPPCSSSSLVKDPLGVWASSGK